MPKTTDTKKHLPTSDRIYDAAVSLMFERGYHGTSMRDVASSVGIQMSSLYHHFPSKQALLFRIMNQTMDDLIANARVAFAIEGSPREKLISGITSHVNFHAQNNMENFITDSELRSLEPEERKLIVAKRDNYSALFRAVIEDGQSQGQFRQADTSVALAALFSMISSVPAWFKPSGRLSLDSVAQEISFLFLDGLTRN